MKRYFLDISFNGSAYFGWQRQPNLITVQEMLEIHISKLVRKSTLVMGAGRTDTGVHCQHIIAHFDVPEEQLPLYADFQRRLNLILPPDIVINSIREVQLQAHARFSATYRRYKYFFHTQKTINLAATSWHLPYSDINFNKLIEISSVLKQQTDFACLSKKNENNATTLCTIYHLEWHKMADANRFYLDIQANRFLHNMVRRIVGLSIAYARNLITLEQIQYVLSDSERRFTKNFKAPSNGLFLWQVGYPESVYLIEQND